MCNNLFHDALELLAMLLVPRFPVSGLARLAAVVDGLAVDAAAVVVAVGAAGGAGEDGGTGHGRGGRRTTTTSSSRSSSS